MEKSVIFRDDQEVQALDFNNMQDWLAKSVDDVVADAIWPDKAYAGFVLSKTDTAKMTVSAGRLYWNGQVYANDDAQVIDLFNILPIVQQKQIAIVAWNQTILTDNQSRGFLIDAVTGQAQPQSVAMTQVRYANIGTVAGVEAAQPQFPAVPDTQLLIGYVLCDPTGIVSFQQVTANMIDSVEDVSHRASALETWRTQITGQVDTLKTAMANLATQFSNYTLLTDFTKLMTLVNQIWQLVNKPASYIYYGTDNYLDTSQSQTAANVDGAYNATINEGLRFPGSVSASNTTLSLLNPSDSSVVVTSDGLVIPKPSGSRARVDCAATNLPWVTERILSFTYWSFSCRKLRPSRYRHCSGLPFLPAPAAQVWWYQAQMDPTAHILSFISETWETVDWKTIGSHPEGGADWPRHNFERFQYRWRDYVDLPYWSKTYDNFSHAGNHICQTILNDQDGWLSGITLFSMNKMVQPLTVIISLCDENGVPDHVNQTVQRVVLDADGVQASYDTPVVVGDIEVITKSVVLGVGSPWDPHNSHSAFRIVYSELPVYVYPLRINLPLTFLQAGKRYAIHVLTTYDHQFAVSDLWDLYAVHQGDYWVSGSTGLYRWNPAPRSLRFKMHFATWGQWQSQTIGLGGAVSTAVQLTALQKLGGISGLQVLAEEIEPDATDLSFQVQISGVWKPLNPAPTAPDFSGSPALLPFQMIFTGTTDLMPAVSLTHSQVTLHGPRATAFHHISSDITLGSAATHVKVIAKVQSFVSAHHTIAASLHYSSTHKTADVVEDLTLDDGHLQRTWTFNTASITDFVVEIDGTTDGVGDLFVVTQGIRYAAA